MLMPPPTITQTSSLVSTMIGTSSVTESRAKFDEDIVISLGDYLYNKSNKALVIKGKKGSRDQGGMDASATNQII